MQPQDPRRSQLTPPQRQVSPGANPYVIPHAHGRPVQQTPPQTQPATEQNPAVANLARSQVESIHARDENHTMPAAQPQPPEISSAQPQATEQPAHISNPEVGNRTAETNQTYSDNPYERTQAHSGGELSKASAKDWQKYHSAWQNYYQQYFSLYYGEHIKKTHEHISKAHTILNEQIAKNQELDKELAAKTSEQTPEEAMTDLRSQLRHRVNTTAKKVRRSTHFVPIAAALIVIVIFFVLQNNRLIFAAVHSYTSPNDIDATNNIVDPTDTVAVGDETEITIPSLSVEAPIIWDTTPDYDSQMKAMENGVAWFGIPGANAKPGQVGNTVLSGHRTNDWLEKGDYKFIFVRLDELTKDDLIRITYKGTRYTYKVTKKEVVEPTDVKALTYETDAPVLTLITCTPLGTSQKRLLVTAEQISPSPETAETAPATTDNSQVEQMSDDGQGFFQNLFGG